MRLPVVLHPLVAAAVAVVVVVQRRAVVMEAVLCWQ